MKRLLKLLSVLLTLSPLIVFADTDPFQNHTWHRDTSTLTTKSHDPVPMNGFSYDHSLSYQTPDGFHSNTDLCVVSSPNHLECTTNDKVTFDVTTYSVTVSGSNGIYKYYDAEYPPTASPISGVWKDIGERHGYEYTCPGKVMNIPFQEYGATTFNNITISDAGGFSTSNTYYLFKYWDNKVYLGSYPGNTTYNSFALLDANDQPITELSNVDNVVKMIDTYAKSCILMK